MDREINAESGARVGTSSTAIAVPLPLIGEGNSRFAKGHAELRKRTLTYASAGGAKPNADARGGLEGFTPPHFKGADIGFGRTIGIHPRRAPAQ